MSDPIAPAEGSPSHPGPEVIPPFGMDELMQLAARMGIVLPSDRTAPTIDLGQPISTLANELANLLRRQPIFLKAGEVVTVNEETGEPEQMTSKRFPAWVEAFTAFRAPGQRRRNSLAPDEAAQILATDLFRGSLKPLDAVHKMRLPVIRRSGAVEFLAPGYDRETRTYTVELLRYDPTWGIERATQFLDAHGEEYCFTWPQAQDSEERPPIAGNRSWAVQIAAMLGCYCKAMFPAGTPRPLIGYIGNKPGTGKSTLVAMALLPVFGAASATALPKDQDRLVSTLETVARTRKPYLFFDDVGGGIFSPPLYEFITAQSHTGRIMGANSAMFEEANCTQVFVTGNGIKCDGNLARRGLFVDMFLDTEVRGRKFKRIINAGYLARPEVRAQFLSALCAIVRNYAEQRDHMLPQQWAAISPLESFEDWSGPISAMVQLAGYADPLAPAPLLSGGNEAESEMKALLVRTASSLDADQTFSRSELTEKARDWNLLESLVGIKGDPPLDGAATRRWGRRLQELRAQLLVDHRGRRFRVGDKHTKAGAAYPFVFV